MFQCSPSLFLTFTFKSGSPWDKKFHAMPGILNNLRPFVIRWNINIPWTGIIYRDIFCSMSDLHCSWLIAEDAQIFWRYVKQRKKYRIFLGRRVAKGARSFFEIYVITEYKFTLENVCDMIKIYVQVFTLLRNFYYKVFHEIQDQVCRITWSLIWFYDYRQKTIKSLLWLRKHYW